MKFFLLTLCDQKHALSHELFPIGISIAEDEKELHDIKVSPKELLSDKLLKSLENAQEKAYEFLSFEREIAGSAIQNALYEGGYFIRFKLRGDLRHAIGDSADLLFAMAAIAFLIKGKGNCPPFAATGELKEKGLIGKVGGVPAKLRAALDALPQGGMVFYPSVNDPEVTDKLRDIADRRKVKLCPVKRLDEAVSLLGIETHRIFSRPWTGLRPYDIEDAPMFFGRNREVNELIRLLSERAEKGLPGVLVLAASGLGKSSLVRAGLVPALRRHFPNLPFCGAWRPSDIGQIIDERTLVKSLLNNWQHRLPWCRAGACKKVRSLVQLYSLVSGKVERFVWIIDQMEELFSQHFPNELRTIFCSFLRDLQKLGIWVVVTLRNDFYDSYADEQLALMDMFGRSGQYDLRSLDKAALRLIIEEPAKRAVDGLSFELDNSGVSLADRLLEAMDSNTDALPLLSFVLDGLYEARGDDGRLTFESYEKLGGLKGAIAHRAEETYTGLDKEAQGSLPALLWLLTAKGDMQHVVARSVYLSAYREDDPARRLISAFIEARLLMGDERKVQITHEALLKEWSRAAEIIAEFVADKPLEARLIEDAETWRKERRLIKDRDLDKALDLLERRGELLSPLVVELIRASSTRRKRRLKIIVSGTAIVVSILVVSTVFAIWQKREAEKQTVLALSAEKQAQEAKQKAEAQALRSLSGKLVGQSILAATQPSPKNGYIDHALLLAAQANKLAPDSPEAQENLLYISQKIDHINRYFRSKKYIHMIKAITFSFRPDTFVTVDKDGALLLWDTEELSAPGKLWQTHAGIIENVTLGPGMWGIFNLSGAYFPIPFDQKNKKSFQSPIRWNEYGEVTSVAFSTSAGRIVNGTKDGTIVLWDVASGKPIGLPWQWNDPSQWGDNLWEWGEMAVLSLAFSSDGKRVVSGHYKGVLVLWDVASGKPLMRFLPKQWQEPVTSIYFSGKQVISGSQSGTLTVWDVTSSKFIKRRSWKLNSEAITSIDSNGSDVVTGSADGTLALLEKMNSGESTYSNVSNWKMSASITSVAFSPFWNISRNRSIIAAGEDGALVSWNLDIAGSGYSSSASFKIYKTHLYDEVYGRQDIISPDGKLQLISGNGRMELRNVGEESGKIWPLWLGDIIVFSSDGKKIISGSRDDGELTLWDVASGKPILGRAHCKNCPPPYSPVNGQPWKWKDQDDVTSIAFSPDGKQVASADIHGMLVIWDITHDKPIGRLLQCKDQGEVTGLAFSPDGKQVASGGEHGMLILWDVASGKPIGQPWPGHTENITNIIFSPDGKKILSFTGKVLMLWDAMNGKAIGQPRLIDNDLPIIGFGFSQDSKQVVIEDLTGKRIVLDVDLTIMVSRVCEKVNRNFTREEWSWFIGDNVLPYQKTCEQFSLEE